MQLHIYIYIYIHTHTHTYIQLHVPCALGSAVSIVTGYGLDGPGIESRWGARPWGPSSLQYNEYQVFPGDKERPGCDADPSPPSGAVVMKR